MPMDWKLSYMSYQISYLHFGYFMIHPLIEITQLRCVSVYVGFFLSVFLLRGSFSWQFLLWVYTQSLRTQGPPQNSPTPQNLIEIKLRQKKGSVFCKFLLGRIFESFPFKKYLNYCGNSGK